MLVHNKMAMLSAVENARTPGVFWAEVGVKDDLKQLAVLQLAATVKHSPAEH